MWWERHSIKLFHYISIRLYLFNYLGVYVAFNTVQVISRRVVGRAEETSTYRSSGFCTVNCRPMASNYQLSHLRSGREPNPDLRGGKRECYHSTTVPPPLHYTALLRPAYQYTQKSIFFTYLIMHVFVLGLRERSVASLQLLCHVILYLPKKYIL